MKKLFFLIPVLVSLGLVYLVVGSETMTAVTLSHQVTLNIHANDPTHQLTGRLDKELGIYDLTEVYVSEQKIEALSPKEFSEKWSGKAWNNTLKLAKPIELIDLATVDDVGVITLPMQQNSHDAVYLIQEVQSAPVSADTLRFVPIVLVLPIYSSDSQSPLKTIDIYLKHKDGSKPVKPTAPTEEQSTHVSNIVKTKPTQDRLPSTKELKSLYLGLE
ncbi:hypothetical protein CBF34_04485 [Vagococcus penaei]|uniref:Uncharacterized protein n=1 Tax=Vagococcus penaei TaxID=633807 RepID=A0A1Q2D505_9ENTE|nr:pilin N-terminal domain-containing protein [Vagococcus penaei]AQP53287.1 hypothetical protein BW732_02910 [Vagococcus penaei]RSU04057.1 hypothetical protein CBF34_04485 [Vagococcus penaei]